MNKLGYFIKKVSKDVFMGTLCVLGLFAAFALFAAIAYTVFTLAGAILIGLLFMASAGEFNFMVDGEYKEVFATGLVFGCIILLFKETIGEFICYLVRTWKEA
jgi:hypothetical protein